MISELDVNDYEDIIDYIEWQDYTDGQSMITRECMEEEWDTISLELKRRILAVDHMVVDRYADVYENDNKYTRKFLALIKKRIQQEDFDPTLCH